MCSAIDPVLTDRSHALRGSEHSKIICKKSLRRCTEGDWSLIRATPCPIISMTPTEQKSKPCANA